MYFWDKVLSIMEKSKNPIKFINKRPSRLRAVIWEVLLWPMQPKTICAIPTQNISVEIQNFTAVKKVLCINNLATWLVFTIYGNRPRNLTLFTRLFFHQETHTGWGQDYLWCKSVVGCCIRQVYSLRQLHERCRAHTHTHTPTMNIKQQFINATCYFVNMLKVNKNTLTD